SDVKYVSSNCTRNRSLYETDIYTPFNEMDPKYVNEAIDVTRSSVLNNVIVTDVLKDKYVDEPSRELCLIIN
ncbi:MAG: hypothetical protein ACTS4T_01685, partial [Candidatus Hodgkinia cicadicola]